MKERRNYLEKETKLFGGRERKGGKYSRRNIYCFAKEKKRRKISGENKYKYISCRGKETEEEIIRNYNCLLLNPETIPTQSVRP